MHPNDVLTSTINRLIGEGLMPLINRPLFIEFDEEYPIRMEEYDGTLIDQAGNVESAVSVLYGDLSDHQGQARKIFAPSQYVGLLRTEANNNADCWNIPIDEVIEIDEQGNIII